MDVLIVTGVKAKNVAEAHQRDLLHQDEYGCKCMTYWIDEERENIFCLIEAPDEDAVSEMHNKAHGLIPNKIIEVKSALVNSFLGRLYDPEEAVISDEGLKVFNDPSYRILLITNTTDQYLMRHALGKEKANELLKNHIDIIRRNQLKHGGREAEHEGTEFIISFSSAAKSVACAMEIQKDMGEALQKALNLRMVINGGEPVDKSNRLFGETIQFGTGIFAFGGRFRIAIASSVKELVSKDILPGNKRDFLIFQPRDESLLGLLYSKLEDNWQDVDFDINDFCQGMAMSKSKLYRKTISLTGFSPNLLLKEFRLVKAMELMRKQQFNIAQITFESGFTSASYFTKCFKKKYGLLPMAYLELIN